MPHRTPLTVSHIWPFRKHPGHTQYIHFTPNNCVQTKRSNVGLWPYFDGVEMMAGAERDTHVPPTCWWISTSCERYLTSVQNTDQATAAAAVGKSCRSYANTQLNVTLEVLSTVKMVKAEVGRVSGSVRRVKEHLRTKHRQRFVSFYDFRHSLHQDVVR